jgi:cyclase
MGLTEVAEGVFAYAQHDGTWWVNTTGFLAAAGQVLAVDACATEKRTLALLDTIGRTVGGPVRTLVNTHFHGDHTYGNSLFTDAVIVGHERCRAALLADTLLARTPPVWDPTPDWGSVTIAPPTVTFTERLSLWVGDVAVEVTHLGGSAHTDSDVVVHVPSRNVLFTGDLIFNGGTPMLLSGSVTGYLETLARLRALLTPSTVLVPGHGEPCTIKALDIHERYARFVLNAAREGRAAGLPPLETARSLDLGEFAALTDPERIVLNLHRAYADLAAAADAADDDEAAAAAPTPAAPASGEVDLLAAFGDAIAYHGGRLRCVV